MRRVVQLFVAVVLGSGLAVAAMPETAMALCPSSGCGGGGGDTFTSHLTVVRSPLPGLPSPTTDVGYVSSAEATPAIDCGTQCTLAFDTDGTVTERVTASSLNGWTLDHWDGCVATTGASCDPPTSAAETVTAYFADTAAPSVTILSAPTAYSHVRNVSMTVGDSDNDQVSAVHFFSRTGGGAVTYDGAAITSPAGTTSHTFSTDGLADGTRDFGAEVRDYSGHVRSVELTLVLDRTVHGPSVSSPTNGAWFNSHDVTVEWGPVDSDVTSVRCRVDTGILSACSSPWTASVPDGAHALHVQVEDSAGNTAEVSRTINVDTSSPALAFAPEAPEDNLVTNQTSLSYPFTADGTGSTVTTSCRVDGAAFSPCADAAPATDLVEGDHAVDVQAVDQAGNTSLVSRQVAVDLTAPVVTVTAGPVDNATISTASASYAFTATDLHNPTATCQWDSGTPATCDIFQLIQ